MELPTNIYLPFFAYGLFRTGQLAFFQIRDFISEVVEPAQIKGRLRLRDGLLLIDPNTDGSIKGALLTFRPDQVAEAYNCISDMEPDKLYYWKQVSVDGIPANALVGKSPKKGSEPYNDVEWTGWDDPLFNAALEVVEETLKSEDSKLRPECPKPFFRLQMAYLLLWSSIERYVSLRYHLGKDATNKVSRIAEEPAFAAGLKKYVEDRREVYRANDPSEKEVLNPENPKKSVNYYYQIRSNIVHRGKAVRKDHDLLKKSLEELLPIFREVLQAAEQDSYRLSQNSMTPPLAPPQSTGEGDLG